MARVGDTPLTQRTDTDKGGKYHFTPVAISFDLRGKSESWIDTEGTSNIVSAKTPKASLAEEVRNLLIHFLVHVANHLAAASKLLTGTPVTDVFGVAATVEDDVH